MPDPTPRLRNWRVIFPDGTFQLVLCVSLPEALRTARELCPGWVRIEQEGDW